MLICGGGAGIPFTFPIITNKVRHVLILGPTGTGKSTLIGAMVTAYTSIPNARIFALDIDRSSFVLAHLLNADYYDVGADGAMPLCPMATMDQPGGEKWLKGWFERLLGRWPGELNLGGFELSERESEDFAIDLRRTYRQGGRRLFDLRANIHSGEPKRERIRRILSEYIDDDAWGYIFNGDKGGNTGGGQVSVYEVSELMELEPRARIPALELILHNITASLDGVSPTFIFMDEFWRFLEDETAARWMSNALRRLRKKNAGVIASTQSINEIVASPFKSQMLESFPAKVLLPNPEAWTNHVAKNYLDIGILPHEIALIASSIPAHDYYFKSASGCRKFTLGLGQIGQSICAATSNADVAQAREIFAQCDPLERLDAWLSARIPEYESSVSIVDAT